MLPRTLNVQPRRRLRLCACLVLILPLMMSRTSCRALSLSSPLSSTNITNRGTKNGANNGVAITNNGSNGAAGSNSSSSSGGGNSPRPRVFYVLRHGQTNANADGIIQGSSDVSRLTSLGRLQAEAIGSVALSRSTATPIGSVYSSPLTRARDTLSIVRQAAPTAMLPPQESDTILDNLREIDFYSWENKHKEELIRQHPREYAAFKAGDPDGVVVNGRRPLWELWDRADEVWDEIRRRSMTSRVDGNKATLLMCHGTLGQALLGAAFGLDATIFRRNTFPNCGMAEILWNDGDELATSWRWHYPTPTEHGCLREQMMMSTDLQSRMK